MKKMNIGLVGAGFMGKAHMVAFSNMPKLFTDLFLVTVQMLILNGSMQKMMNLQWESWKHFRVAESMTLRKKHSLETNHTLQDAADLTNCMQ